MWICHGRPVSWLLYSPADLYPLDFFLWGCFKENAYPMEVKDHNNLTGDILVDAIETRCLPKELGPVRDSV
jgi:hypothetical protein